MPTDPGFERRMLIDGKLVEGRAGGFGNINPATEEMLGEVSDASAEACPRRSMRLVKPSTARIGLRTTAFVTLSATTPGCDRGGA